MLVPDNTTGLLISRTFDGFWWFYTVQHMLPGKHALDRKMCKIHVFWNISVDFRDFPIQSMLARKHVCYKIQKDT